MSESEAFILFKLTTRSRPERAKEVIDSIRNNVDSDRYLILVSVDKNDDTAKILDFYVQEYSNVLMVYGESKNKIDAINRDIQYFGWDILVNVSDDTVFIQKGFDTVIRKAFIDHFPDYDGVVHFPDGNRKDLLTMSIIGFKYYMRDKYIYHPDYVSLWCDNEAMDVAKIRGKYIFIDNQIFEHKHWAYGKAICDNQYAIQNGYFNQDKITYEQRRANNFGL